MQMHELTNEQLLQAIVDSLPEEEKATLIAIAAHTSAHGKGRPDMSTVAHFAKAFGVEVGRVAPFFGYVPRRNRKRWVDVAEGAQAPSDISAVHRSYLPGLFTYRLLGGRMAFTDTIH